MLNYYLEAFTISVKGFTEPEEANKVLTAIHETLVALGYNAGSLSFTPDLMKIKIHCSRKVNSLHENDVR